MAGATASPRSPARSLGVARSVPQAFLVHCSWDVDLHPFEQTPQIPQDPSFPPRKALACLLVWALLSGVLPAPITGQAG